MAPKGATTPYFAFMNANRAAVKAALLEAGAPAAMGDIGKELGARWRALSEEEKKVYVDQVAAAKEAAKEAAGGAGEEDAARDAPEEEAGPATLPLARVKRIIRLDPDVKQTQLDAVRLISRATELFVESLAAGAYGVMKGTKRKTMKFTDIEQHVMRRNKLKFMHDHIAATATVSAKTKEKEGGASGAGRAAGGAGPEAGAAGQKRSISAFFAPAAAGGAAAAAAGPASADASDAEPSADVEEEDGDAVGDAGDEPSGGADDMEDDDA